MLVLVALLQSAYADTCAVWAEAEAVAEVQGGTPESSGVAWSRTRADVWFTHGDKGSRTELVAFNLEGEVVGTHEVTGAVNEDWEDLAAAPCPDVGDCLYIADIGDNNADRDSISVHIVREPGPGERARVIDSWEAVYPGGPRDAEALLVHPCSAGIHIITKNDDGRATVFRYPAVDEKSGVVLEEVGSFQLEGITAESRRVTGAAYDSDGDRLIVRTADRFWEWDIDPSAPNAHWGAPPREVGSLSEAQGEAVTYGPAGDVFTTSEGLPMTVGQIACEEPVASDHECTFPQTGGCGCRHSGPPGVLVALVPLLLLRRRRHA